MHVSLTGKLDEYVRDKVATGLYNNASEVIREALRLKIATEETEQVNALHLREAIELGWDQADQGKFSTYSLAKTAELLQLDI